MGKRVPDLTVFDTIDQVVADLVQRQIYRPFHPHLSQIAVESESVIECLNRLDLLLRFMDDAEQRRNLPQSWHTQYAAQIRELEEGYEALVAVLTKILPQRALRILEGTMQ